MLFVGDKADNEGCFYTAIVAAVIPAGAPDERQHPLNALPVYQSKAVAGKHTVCCERSDGVSFDLISFIPKMKGNEIREEEAIHAVYYGTETKRHKSSEAIVRLAVPALSTRFASRM